MKRPEKNKFEYKVGMRMRKKTILMKDEYITAIEKYIDYLESKQPPTSNTAEEFLNKKGFDYTPFPFPLFNVSKEKLIELLEEFSKEKTSPKEIEELAQKYYQENVHVTISAAWRTMPVGIGHAFEWLLTHINK